MSKSSGHLIVIFPDVHRFWKTRVSRAALYAFAIGFVASFLAVVWMGYTFPPLVNDADRIRLEIENQSLRSENKDVSFKMQRLNVDVDRLQTMSEQVEAGFSD